jgi:putative acyl-CoA dehydrogenase
MALIERMTNVPPPLEDYNVFTSNRPLVESLQRWAPSSIDDATAFGELVGRAHTLEQGRLANEHPPSLRGSGEITFHPAWHELMRIGREAGLTGLGWDGTPRGNTARGATFITLNQVEAGVMCPMCMTHGAVATLRARPDLAAEWEPRLISRSPDGAWCGMAMTERQGGSDVQANTTRATPSGDGEATLHGEKWFCSVPQSDAFLTLAQAPSGLSCYFVPRDQPGFHVRQLKNKLGNRSNATAEVELEGVSAWLVGEEGKGVHTIMEMVSRTRIDCVLGSAALMRRAVAEAIHHCAHRSAFGRPLIEQPLMQNVLADLCVESEAATLMAMRLVHALDEGETEFLRLATPVAKFWVCKVTPWVVAEALECIGGDGFVEDSPLPRIYRESPLNSIWEGAGNIQALDVLRAVRKQPETLDAFLAEAGAVPGLDLEQEANARKLIERLALALQRTLVVRYGAPAVADAFIARGGSQAYGTLPTDVDFAGVIERHRAERVQRFESA